MRKASFVSTLLVSLALVGLADPAQADATYTESRVQTIEQNDAEPGPDLRIATTTTFDSSGNPIKGVETDDLSVDGHIENVLTFLYSYDNHHRAVREQYLAEFTGDGATDYSYTIERTFDPDGFQTSERYSEDWNGDGVFDASSRWTRRRNVLSGRLIEIVESSFDGTGERVGYSSRRFTYDAQQNVVLEEFAGFDAAGHLGEFRNISRTFDQRRNKLTEVFGYDFDLDGQPDFFEPNTYVYDNQGNVVREEHRGVEVVIRSFDNRRRVTFESHSLDYEPDGILDDQWSTSFEYNSLGGVVRQVDEFPAIGGRPFAMRTTTQRDFSNQGLVLAEKISYDIDVDGFIERTESRVRSYDTFGRLTLETYESVSTSTMYIAWVTEVSYSR